MNDNFDFEKIKSKNKNIDSVYLQDTILIDELKTKKQILLNLKGIQIYFPYKPYDIQIKYMEKIIDSLNNNYLAALESPTGTGKTLCLLCATLAWMKFMRKKKKKQIRMYYSTRTHSQISNVIKELKKTVYLPITCILSSRDKSCVNYKVKNNSKNLCVLNSFCKKNKHNCSFYRNVNNIPILSNNLIDIEELCDLGINQKFCPYHYEKDKSYNSDIIFSPFNYIIDKEIKDTLRINIENSILIIDEAHNIDKILEDNWSIELKTNSLNNMIIELNNIILEKRKNDKYFSQFSENDILKEINIIKNIKKKIEEISEVLNGEVYPNKGKILNPDEFFSLFIQFHIKNQQMKIEDMFNNNNNYEGLTSKNINKHYNFLYSLKEEYLDVNEENLLTPYVKMLELIKFLFFNSEYLKSFLFYVYDSLIESQNIREKVRILKLFCFDSGFGFKKLLLEKPVNIILTSGTLSPIETLEFNLKVPIEIKLQNNHIINLNNSKFEIITSINYNENKIKFQFDNTNRHNLEMIECLGNTILNYVKSLSKGGILVFFPSFNYLNNCYSKWVSSGLINKISKYKTVYYDNKHDIKLLNKIILDNKKNSILFSVVRSSISEGINFTDEMARIVICIGIPYANFWKDKIKLKMVYLDKYMKLNKDKKSKLISGERWYKIDAIQAVNQSLGRVLRHKDDYGIMICIDSRFDNSNIRNLFSKWMNDICEVKYIDNNHYFENIKNFFDKMDEDFRKKKFENNTKNIIIENKEENNQRLMTKFNLKNDNNSHLISPFKDKNGFINIKELNKQKNKGKKFYSHFENQGFLNFNTYNFLGKKYKKEESNENSLKLEMRKTFNSHDIINNNKKDNISNNQNNDTETEDSNNYNFIENRNKYEKKLIQSNTKSELENEQKKELILDNNKYTIEKDEDYLNCPICFTKYKDTDIQFSISKCGHILCNNCWLKWLKTKMECPLCKKKCRIKTLKRVIKKS